MYVHKSYFFLATRKAGRRRRIVHPCSPSLVPEPTCKAQENTRQFSNNKGSLNFLLTAANLFKVPFSEKRNQQQQILHNQWAASNAYASQLLPPYPLYPSTARSRLTENAIKVSMVTQFTKQIRFNFTTIKLLITRIKQSFLNALYSWSDFERESIQFTDWWNGEQPPCNDRR